MWHVLTERHPHFEFVHGAGLGVLGAGDDLPPALQHLFSLDAATERALSARQAALALVTAEEQTGVVQLHDAGDQAIDADCHNDSDRDQHADLDHECLLRHRAERDHDDLGRENEVGANCAFDLVTLEGD